MSFFPTFWCQELIFFIPPTQAHICTFVARTSYHIVQIIPIVHLLHTILKWNFTYRKHCSECVGEKPLCSQVFLSVFCIFWKWLKCCICKKARWLAWRSTEFVALCFSPQHLNFVLFLFAVKHEWWCGADQKYLCEIDYQQQAVEGVLQNLVFLVCFRLCRSLPSWQWISWSLVSLTSCWEMHTMLSTNKVSHPLPKDLLSGDKT